MKVHQKLTIVGGILLAVTYLIYNYHQTEHPGIGFNYAYVTGISMMIVFIASIILFGIERLKESKSKK